MAAASPVVIVLASGRGERFLASGGTTHKLRARLGDRTVLQHTLAAVQASGLPWHLEEAGHPGMGDSIAAAVRARPEASAWLILPGDLPLVRPETIRWVAQAPADQTVVRPFYQGRAGHPVRFASACGPALRALSGDEGALSVARRFALARLDVPDPGCVLDIDTVDDLNRAEALWRDQAGARALDRGSRAP